MVLFSYCLSVAALWLQSTLYPQLPLLAFSPFLTLVSLRCSVDKALIFSSLAGLIIDLLSNDPFGLHALTYCLATAACYRLKNLFSAEIPIQLALFTALLSAAATLIHILLLFLFDRRVPFCGIWWISDWTLLPIVDAFYALIWFAGPLSMFQTLRRYWVIYWLKKKNPSLT